MLIITKLKTKWLICNETFFKSFEHVVLSKLDAMFSYSNLGFFSFSLNFHHVSSWLDTVHLLLVPTKKNHLEVQRTKGKFI